MREHNPETGKSYNAGSSSEMTSLAEKLSRLPVALQMEIQAEADEIIAEEMTLQDLRKARRMTQASVAAELGINQENVSRLERRSDFLLSSLRSYIEAMGGKLQLVAEFPDRQPVSIDGLSDLDDDPTDFTLTSHRNVVMNPLRTEELELNFKEAFSKTFNREFELVTESEVADFGKNYLEMVRRNSEAIEAFSTGNAHIEKAEYGEALEAFQSMFGFSPGLIEAYVGSGMAHLGMGNYAKAKETMDQLVSLLHPESSQEAGIPGDPTAGWVHSNPRLRDL